MTAFTATTFDTPPHVWARIRASSHLGDALHTLNDAVGTLRAVVDDTAWESAALRALHEGIERQHHAASAEVERLRGVRDHCLGGDRWAG